MTSHVQEVRVTLTAHFTIKQRCQAAARSPYLPTTQIYLILTLPTRQRCQNQIEPSTLMVRESLKELVCGSQLTP